MFGETITVRVEFEVKRSELIEALVLAVHRQEAPTSRRAALKLVRSLLWQHGSDREGAMIVLEEMAADSDWDEAAAIVDDLFPELMPGDIDGRGGPS